MERITVKCPKCMHKMDIDPKVIAFRCSQCGAKIDLDERPVSDVKEDSRGWQEFNKYNRATTTRKVNDTIMHIADRIAEDRERERERVERHRKEEREHPFRTMMPILIMAGLYIFFILLLKFL